MRNLVEALEMRILSWVFYLSPTCDHTCPPKREEEGDFRQKRRRHVTTETGTVGMVRPQAKECQEPSETGRG